MKPIKAYILFTIITFLILSPVYVASKTKTISGTITAVEGGNGSVGTTITINLGSNNNLKKGDLGWVSKGDENIAYIKILSVENNSAIAIVTTHEHVAKVTSGLRISFKVDVKEEIIPEKKTVSKIKEPTFLWRFGRFNIANVPETVKPLFSNGTIYFGSSELYALNSMTGKQCWKFDKDVFESSIFPINSPMVYSNTLYVCNSFSICAFNIDTGYLFWAKQTEQVYDGPPVFIDNMLFYSVIHQGIIARDARSGSLLWRYKTYESIYNAPIIFDSKVYGWDQEQVYCLNSKTGSLIWKKKVKPRTEEVVNYKNTLIIPCVEGLFCLDKDSGEIVKQQRYPSNFGFGDFFRAHSVINGSNVFYNIESSLISINLDSGRVNWEAKLEGSTRFSAPVLSKGRVYIGDNDGYVYALDAYSGKILWRYTEENIKEVYGLCVENSILYFICVEGLKHTSVDGWLYAIKIQ